MAPDRQYSITIFHHPVRLMLMTYLGTLKTLLYWPVLSVFGGNVWSVRIPVALVGALTVGFFYFLAKRSLSPPMAVIAAVLLAVDPTFLLTDTFDWGPVALEHLLLVSACVLLLGFVSSPEDTPGVSGRGLWKLAGAFFCLGLALWNKAIFLWALSGLLVAGVAVFLPEIRKHSTWRKVGVSIAAFVLGASPFLLYNIRRPNRTLSANAHLELDTAVLSKKLYQLQASLKGNTVFGYLVTEEWRGSPKVPQNALGRASTWLRDRIGQRRESYFDYASAALLVLGAPWWWRRRAARFSLIFCGVSWLAMAVTLDAGGSVHHNVLLWPFPVLFAAVALDSLPWRKFSMAAGVAMILLNLSVLNQYLAQFVRYGAENVYTDAILPLSQTLAESGKHVYVIDWGIYDVLLVMHRGSLHQSFMDGLSGEAPNTDAMNGLRAMFADPDALVVDHVREREVYDKPGEHLDRVAEALGYRKEVWRTIADSNGRPAFEVLRFHGAGADAAKP